MRTKNRIRDGRSPCLLASCKIIIECTQGIASIEHTIHAASRFISKIHSFSSYVPSSPVTYHEFFRHLKVSPRTVGGCISIPRDFMSLE